MIELHPNPEVKLHCPHDDQPLRAIGWYIPGMRTIADLVCDSCGRAYYGDMPAGHGLYYPCLLDKSSEEVFDTSGVNGFQRDWLKQSYAERTSAPLNFEVCSFHSIEKTPLVLNCIDRMYGHSLLKLLNVQYYLDNCPEIDVIVIIQPFLKWLIPDGVAEAWVVDIPLREGIVWNDWLASEIQRRLSQYEKVFLSVAFSHPHPNDYDIARFTRIQPFSEANWQAPGPKTVTFVWRDDRMWENFSDTRLGKRIARKFKNQFMTYFQWKQRRMVIELGEHLKSHFNNLRFVVVGLSKYKNMPPWIEDLRVTSPTLETERLWCEIYSESHVVVGVHGSNMLLPSGLAGSVVELLPHGRGNIIQDLLFNSFDPRINLAHYRILPIQATPGDVADAARIIVNYHNGFAQKFPHNACNHETTDIFSLKTLSMRVTPQD